MVLHTSAGKDFCVMSEPLTLTDLIQEHFDGVLETIERGRWGRWVLEREGGRSGRLVLVHEGVGYSIVVDAVGAATDWVAVVAGKDWATASDVGQLIFAIRDLEYARWLGILPGEALPALAAAK
jgi:hypothetical protein